LAALARDATAAFGSPQDIEWALIDDEIVVLQSRPITALEEPAVGHGPVFGPGPLAETFPAPLARLEQELWLDPLRDALREVLSLTGAAPRRRIATSPLVVTVDGRVAADLELFGDHDAARPRSFLARLDPRPPTRRVRVAWRVGRLRASLPALVRDVIRDVDRQLSEVPSPTTLSDSDLLTLLGRGRQALVAVYGHEMLIGQLLANDTAGLTAAGAAMRVLAEQRDADLTDEVLIARYPVLLALVPPAIGTAPELPTASRFAPQNTDAGDEAAVLREAARLRARWLQELTGRAALELGRRLHDRHLLAAERAVRRLGFDQLRRLALGITAIEAVPDTVLDGTPLPARFRLSEAGRPVAVRSANAGSLDARGRGAGGGRNRGVVRPADTLPATGAVLVVRTLDPGLAPRLPGLHGLIAETGSSLSHLAILARELGIPTVVGVSDAIGRFPPGTDLVVDGASGEIEVAAAGNGAHSSDRGDDDEEVTA
jgi:pyruvate,water dikinase